MRDYWIKVKFPVLNSLIIFRHGVIFLIIFIKILKLHVKVGVKSWQNKILILAKIYKTSITIPKLLINIKEVYPFAYDLQWIYK